MHIIVKDRIRGCKSLSELLEAMVKFLTKGNVFLYNDDPDGNKKIEAARKWAEAQSLEWIRQSLDSIPKKVKRDIEV